MHEVFESRRYLIPFRSLLLPQVFVDTLVVGSGAAGYSAALGAAARGSVIVLCKGPHGGPSSSAWAQGGIAAVLDDGDTVGAHVDDTLRAGAGLCDEGVVRSVCGAGPGVIRGLLEAGFHADHDPGGVLALAQEGGHSARRIIRSDGDGTGAELVRTLRAGVEAHESIRVFDRCFALDLITAGDEPGGACLGAITHHPRYGLQMIWARTTILAAGGAGVLWRETSNPPASTGDAVAMAWRAGADVADLAFEQFHPTTLYVAGGDRALISEAVRGEGAYLLDNAGVRFMVGVHPRAELAPRDVVSAAIHGVLKRTGAPHVWLDARHVGGFAERFPWINARLRDFGLDPSVELIPVNPAAHYSVGGVWAGTDGQTSVPGLLAVGEAACTGLHGANRLASNSLLEALVCGEAAGGVAAERAAAGASESIRHVPIVSQIREERHAMIDLTDIRSSLRSVMWRSVGIVREPEQLSDVCEMCDFWGRYTMDKVFDDPFAWETQNLLTLGALVARSASWRRESRGCHRRADVTKPVEAFEMHDVWRRGAVEPSTVAVAGVGAA